MNEGAACSAKPDEILKQNTELKEQTVAMDAAGLVNVRFVVCEEKEHFAINCVKTVCDEK